MKTLLTQFKQSFAGSLLSRFFDLDMDRLVKKPIINKTPMKNELEKEFVPYEEALALEELGFDEKNILAYYTIEDKRLVNGYSLSANGFELKAPTFSQAFRWFRERYGIFNPQRLIFETFGGKYGLQSHDEHDQVDGYYDTYEEAELACLRKLIEIVKSQS